mmetsp:Transcript_28504/g.60151  ORF Transcript_28504/g.60151 Transcript_28504/m.60151 type:complete len:94 (+) Transcript_28504:506-787(+)
MNSDQNVTPRRSTCSASKLASERMAANSDQNFTPRRSKRSASKLANERMAASTGRLRRKKDSSHTRQPFPTSEYKSLSRHNSIATIKCSYSPP